MSNIETRLIDASLFSGSSDTFRNEIGGYWYTFDVDENNSSVNFRRTNVKNITSIESRFIERIYSQEGSAERFSEDSILPNFMYPVRITARDDEIKDDTHWKTVLLGGTWGNKTYNRIYSDNVFEYFNIRNDLPYDRKSANALNGVQVGNPITIGYDYRQYLPRYERRVRNLESEHLLPNFYILADLSKWTPSDRIRLLQASSLDNDTKPFGPIGQLYSRELLNFVSREENYNEIYDLFTFTNEKIPYVAPRYVLDSFKKIRSENTFLSVNYLTGAFVLNELSDTTKQWAQSKMQNIIFDNEAMSTFANFQPLQQCLPYYTFVSMPSRPVESFGKSIIDNKFSSKFVKTLYQVFNNNVEELEPTTQAFTEARDYYSGSADGTITNIKRNNASNYRQINYVDFLVYCHNQYNTDGENDNCLFIGNNTIDRLIATEESEAYRYSNAKNALNVLNDVVNFVENPNNIKMDEFQNLFSQELRQIETLAYRVEKVGGPPTGDSQTQNTLQNFWFMNTQDPKDFNFYDSQVRYGTDYTYTVYAYVLAVGVKYQTSDLIISSQLGCEDAGQVGLYFYNPSTGDKANELYDSSNSGTDLDGNTAFRIRNATISDITTQIFSSHQYVADFNLKYEPIVKVIEVPIFSKTLRVLDNPGNVLNVRPYQLLNDSKKIGFDFNYQNFSMKTFPQTITADDEDYKNNYLHANDLFDSSIIEEESVSNPRFVQIYRLSERPTSLNSFDGALIRTVDLKIRNEEKYTYTFAFTEDRIVPNQKYYYLFRVLNQLGELSHLTVIYEAELVDDGGYIYGIFNTLEVADLEQKQFESVSREFKKLFQLQPNLNQLTLNTENLDFTGTASSQVEDLTIGSAEDLIWDKTFKIRLTSKKTGRKIDFNITYKLNSE